jgi:pimeloyl-ACP methyl ester carboxylesterase
MLIVLTSYASCIAPQSALRIPPQGEVTVFVHGYKGSFLKEVGPDGQIAWITPGLGLSSGDKSLALPFDGQREFPRYGPLEVTGPITRLTVFPGIIDEDAYDTFMKWGVKALPGFVAFSYDWRLDIRDSAQQLCHFIEALGPGRKINIVAHSMGGLVMLECLLHISDSVKTQVEKVVFLGTPFRGSPGIFDDFSIGSSAGRNTQLLNVEALLTFPSAMELLGPVPPDFVSDSAGHHVEHVPFSAQDWQLNGWGIFRDKALRDNGAYLKQFEAQLMASEKFWKSVNGAESRFSNTQFLAVIGTGRRTVGGWMLQSNMAFDLEHPIEVDGDGVVVAARAVPPVCIGGAQVFSTVGGHNEMLNLEIVRAKVTAFLK